MSAFDVAVVGAGHAGLEAALAAARMGLRTACITMRLDRIGHLPCNCSIGGPAKGHIAREVDALGGQMAVTTDSALTHIRRVGTGRGPAVQTVRAHVCKELYPQTMRRVLEAEPKLTLVEATVEAVFDEAGLAAGLSLSDGTVIRARAIVLTTGTFLNGVCHEGHRKTSAARHGDAPSVGLGEYLRDLGIAMRRFKTGTTPRVRFASLRLDGLERFESEPDAGPVSFISAGIMPQRELLACWQTHTNDAMHDLIRERLHESAMYGGRIEGAGPRYCPSIEDKIVRFADKDRHPIFLEIEDWGVDSVYVQGVSTSLPAETQLAMLKCVKGLENVEMIRPGYAVEYDMADPTQLTPHLMSKLLPGLFLAGQVNGTSGYEEAAGQGIVAGINAARWASDQAPIDFPRSNSFIGVMIDDLVTKGVDDPYRMLTARAEHRLLLRHDNADARLTPVAREIGLCSEKRWTRFSEKMEKIASARTQLESHSVSTAQTALFEEMGLTPLRDRVSLLHLLRRPEIDLDKSLEIGRRCGIVIEISEDRDVREQIELAGIYEGYLEREQRLCGEDRKLDSIRIPENWDFLEMKGLSFESKEKLSRIRPATVGQASRVPGVRVSDIALLIGRLRNRR